MKLRFSIFIFFVAFLLQATFLNAIAILDATPNLMLILLSCYTFFYKDYKGTAIALVFGILLDITSGSLVGVSSLAFLIVAIIIERLKESFNVGNLVVAFPVGVCSTIIFDVVYYFIYFIFDKSYAFTYWLKAEIVHVIYNSLILIIAYIVFSIVINGKRNRYRRWRKF